MDRLGAILAVLGPSWSPPGAFLSHVKALWELAKQALSWRVLHVASPLTDVEHTQWKLDCKSTDSSRLWQSWCPCCKRPLDVTAFGGHEWFEPQCRHNDQPRCAYVIALWGFRFWFCLRCACIGTGFATDRYEARSCADAYQRYSKA
jgi:hypothetical protein